MSGHTPLPWKIVPREVTPDGVFPAHIVGGSRELTICYLEAQIIAENGARDPSFDNDVMVEADGSIRSKKANWSVLENAPALLSALEEIREWLTNLSADNATQHDIFVALQMRAATAIAQAKGEA